MASEQIPKGREHMFKNKGKDADVSWSEIILFKLGNER